MWWHAIFKVWWLIQDHPPLSPPQCDGCCDFGRATSSRLWHAKSDALPWTCGRHCGALFCNVMVQVWLLPDLQCDLIWHAPGLSTFCLYGLVWNRYSEAHPLVWESQMLQSRLDAICCPVCLLWARVQVQCDENSSSLACLFYVEWMRLYSSTKRSSKSLSRHLWKKTCASSAQVLLWSCIMLHFIDRAMWCAVMCCRWMGKSKSLEKEKKELKSTQCLGLTKLRWTMCMHHYIIVSFSGWDSFLCMRQYSPDCSWVLAQWVRRQGLHAACIDSFMFHMYICSFPPVCRRNALDAWVMAFLHSMMGLAMMRTSCAHTHIFVCRTHFLWVSEFQEANIKELFSQPIDWMEDVTWWKSLTCVSWCACVHEDDESSHDRNHMSHSLSAGIALRCGLLPSILLQSEAASMLAKWLAVSYHPQWHPFENTLAKRMPWPFATKDVGSCVQICCKVPAICADFALESWPYVQMVGVKGVFHTKHGGTMRGQACNFSEKKQERVKRGVIMTWSCQKGYDQDRIMSKQLWNMSNQLWACQNMFGTCQNSCGTCQHMSEQCPNSVGTCRNMSEHCPNMSVEIRRNPPKWVEPIFHLCSSGLIKFHVCQCHDWTINYNHECVGIVFQYGLELEQI